MTTDTVIVITRPLQDALLLQQNLKNNGLTSILAPMMRIMMHPLDREVFQKMQAAARGNKCGLLMTSANGARALAQAIGESAGEYDNLYDCLCCCVGGQTAHQAQATGFRRVMTAGGDVDAMLDLFDAHPDWAELQWWHPRAEHHRGNLVQALTQKFIQANAFCAYTAQATATLPAALQAYSHWAVVLYSPRTAALWQQALLRAKGLPRAMTAYCLSPAVAEKLSGCRQRVVVANPPTSHRLEELLLIDFKLQD